MQLHYSSKCHRYARASLLIASSNAPLNLGVDRHRLSRHHPSAHASRAVRTSVPPPVALFGARRRRVGAKGDLAAPGQWMKACEAPCNAYDQEFCGRKFRPSLVQFAPCLANRLLMKIMM
jgi:hypothetical protein